MMKKKSKDKETMGKVQLHNRNSSKTNLRNQCKEHHIAVHYLGHVTELQGADRSDIIIHDKLV